jgi:hypothetical protein
MLRQPHQVGSARMVDSPEPAEHVGLMVIRQQPRPTHFNVCIG